MTESAMLSLPSEMMMSLCEGLSDTDVQSMILSCRDMYNKIGNDIQSIHTYLCTDISIRIDGEDIYVDNVMCDRCRSGRTGMYNSCRRRRLTEYMDMLKDNYSKNQDIDELVGCYFGYVKGMSMDQGELLKDMSLLYESYVMFISMVTEVRPDVNAEAMFMKLIKDRMLDKYTRPDADVDLNDPQYYDQEYLYCLIDEGTLMHAAMYFMLSNTKISAHDRVSNIFKYMYNMRLDSTYVADFHLSLHIATLAYAKNNNLYTRRKCTARRVVYTSEANDELDAILDAIAAMGIIAMRQDISVSPNGETNNTGIYIGNLSYITHMLDSCVKALKYDAAHPDIPASYFSSTGGRGFKEYDDKDAQQASFRYLYNCVGEEHISDVFIIFADVDIELACSHNCTDEEQDSPIHLIGTTMRYIAPGYEPDIKKWSDIFMPWDTTRHEMLKDFRRSNGVNLTDRN